LTPASFFALRVGYTERPDRLSREPRELSIRVVFFDAGNTLLRMDYEVIAAELARHGVRVTPDAVERAEWQARVHLDDQVFARAAGASTETQASAIRYMSFVLEALGVVDAKTVERVAEWRRTYNPPVGVWTTHDPQALEALALVRRSGARAAAISNSNGSVESVLAAVGLASHLDFVIDSGEVGVEKPDPRIFELALARAGVAPSEAAYIGDFYSIDVRGASAAGLRAVLLDPGGLWGARDCAMAPDLLSAVRLALSW
jgi:putative hydrolase of the HAD superfamily